MATLHTRLLLSTTLAVALAGCASNPAPGTTSTYGKARNAWLEGDYQQAFPALQRAAESGQARAQYAVGYMYYYGQGVGQDDRRAMQWIRRAADGGDPRAREAMDLLAGNVTAEDRARGGLADPEPEEAEGDGGE
ncbi:tetratricopeptide repeat protein [Arhodomonas sp. SL1]|uniref:tetratricopeptide repeat protein n=1 Tax=Arhodomonas sp. SL1 TaxID=3425691 RepID=UPI003F880439